MRWILVLLSLLPASVPVASIGAVRYLDERSALYHEDAIERRPIASVTARLVEVDGERRLRLAVGAIGAGVDPLPGIEGAPGANLRTAEELDRLLRENALDLVTRVAGVSHAGARTAVEYRAVPVRRIGRNGRVVFDAKTAARWPVHVEFESVPLPVGELWSYLEADGVPRLAVQVVGERITSIESRGTREVGR